MQAHFHFGWRRCRSDWCLSASGTLAYAAKVEAELKAAGFRVETDVRNEKMNAKIRDLANQKIPYILVFGDKEEGAGAVSVRTRGKGDQGSMPLADFIAKAKGQAGSKSTEL